MQRSLLYKFHFTNIKNKDFTISLRSLKSLKMFGFLSFLCLKVHEVQIAFDILMEAKNKANLNGDFA